MIDEKRFTKSQGREISQNVILENRKKLSISGVSDVGSFDEDEVCLYTEAGMLNIKGANLKINKLSVETGEVVVEGEINSLHYTDEEAKSGTSILKKLFK